MLFYQSVFGGELDIATFADLHRSQDPSQDALVAHSTLKGNDGVVLMASDVTPQVDGQTSTGPALFSIALGGTERALTGYWTGLSGDGIVTHPVRQGPLGALHGQCVDKFGINWLVNVAD